MDKVVIAIFQGGVVTQTVLSGLTNNYTVSQKKGDTILLSISLLNIDRFS